MIAKYMLKDQRIIKYHVGNLISNASGKSFFALYLVTSGKIEVVSE